VVAATSTFELLTSSFVFKVTAGDGHSVLATGHVRKRRATSPLRISGARRGQVFAIKCRRFEPTTGGEEGRKGGKELTGGTAMRSVVARARSMRNNARLIDRRYPSRARRPVSARSDALAVTFLDFSVLSAARPDDRFRLGHFALPRHRKSVEFGPVLALPETLFRVPPPSRVSGRLLVEIPVRAGA